MSQSLDHALDRARRDELRRAARALLRRPLLRAGPEEFRLVRRHAGELRAWFDANTGWRLIVDADVARLVKVAPTSDDPGHPAREPRSRAPFGRRRYVLTCLALSVLERSDAQITLGRLAEGMILAAADDRLERAGVAFRLGSRDERTDLVAVVRLLLDLGVLARVAGDEDAFIRDAGDALYDVQRRILAVLLAAPRGPSTISAADFASRLTELTSAPVPEAEELRNRAIRQRLTRRLLDDPVVYYADLDAAEIAYLTSQRAALTKRISDLTGLVAEVRAEGIAMVDPDDDLTDVRMPEIGTDGHVALLLAEHLAARARAHEPEEVAACVEADLHRLVRRLAGEHRAYWRRSAREPGAEVALVDAALERLAALRLVRRAPGIVRPLPALARYGLAAPTLADDDRQSALEVS
ncbi:MAG: TIGR02678 family protein [Solirubrobacteraceae bacterium]